AIGDRIGAKNLGDLVVADSLHTFEEASVENVSSIVPAGRDLKVVWVVEPDEYSEHGDAGYRIPWPSAAVHILTPPDVVAGTFSSSPHHSHGA
ncbi:MAG: hypothetical protein KDB67_16295, partial [Gordonia sp.]|uniref:hypothetical protein n=1 Tax=Gordonia sp. (in: high G+C Gram-positive bacteria) TaxID=84139 RepID=UPI001D64C246